MNYYQFSAEDFAADDYFKEWVCSPDSGSDAFWEAFLRDYPEKYYALQEGRELVEGLQQLHSAKSYDDQLTRIWMRIEDSASGHQKRFRSGRRHTLLWKAAAAVALLLAMGWLVDGRFRKSAFTTGHPETSSDAVAWKEVSNEAAHPHTIALPDGSEVILEKNSRIRYLHEFGDSLREVHLTGEAFFEVRKDPSKPFLVHANGLITKVLGTSFAVQARDSDPNVTVSVKTGRVSVYPGKSIPAADPEAKGIVLTPNQKAVFRRDKETLSKTLVDRPTMLTEDKLRPAFVFEEAPASRVFDALSRLYGIEVLYDEELMKSCSLTLNLSDEDLFQKLEVICKVLEAKYKLIDAQVIIYSNGCS